MTHRNVPRGARRVAHWLAAAIAVAMTVTAAMFAGVATTPGTAYASDCNVITRPATVHGG